MTTDTEKIGKERGWPEGVVGVGLDGLDHLGVKRSTNELYWDGAKLVTERRLANYERVMLFLATMSAVAVAVVEVGSALGLWHYAP